MIKNTSPILSALRAATQSERSAVEFLEHQRWGDAPACPRCGDAAVYKMTSANGDRNKDFRWRCKGCKQMFTVRTNTVFEESRLPLRVWVYAFWKACSSKKGISALQLSREMEITHKSALFVLRRIRHGLGYDIAHDPKMLIGTVEVDETYVGGKPRFRNRPRSEKAPVVAMVQRGGDVRFRALPRITSAGLSDAIAENASISARLMTDEHQMYRGVGMEFLGGHQTVTHSVREYVRAGTDVHSNTVESVFSLLKRGIMGTFHSVSKKHLPNYLNEFEFRYNTRKVDDGTRVSKAIKRVHGKRLTYRESVDNPPYFPPPKQPQAPFDEQ
jgi:transposase-like protein